MNRTTVFLAGCVLALGHARVQGQQFSGPVQNDTPKSTPAPAQGRNRSSLAEMFGKKNNNPPHALQQRFQIVPDNRSENSPQSEIELASFNEPDENEDWQPSFDPPGSPRFQGNQPVREYDEEHRFAPGTMRHPQAPGHVEGTPGSVVGHPNMVVQPPTYVGPDAPPDQWQYSDAAMTPSPTHIPALSEILPGYYAEAGLIYLKRRLYQDETLAVMQFGGLAFANVRSADLDGDFEPGLRFTMGQPVGCGWYIEGTFLGLNNWSETSLLSGGTLQQSVTTFPIANAGAASLGFPSGALTTQQANLDSRFLSGEANFKWAWSVLPHSYFLVGFRAVNMLEKMTVVETGTVGVAANTTVPVVGTMTVRAQNPMIGFQVGWESRYYGFHGRWSLDSHIKGGVLWDLAEVEVDRTLSDSPIGPIASFQSEEETSASGLIDAAIGLSFRLTPTISLRGGYQLIGILGYANAALQQPPSIFSGLNLDPYTSERAFLHGPYATVEWTWGAIR